MGAVNSPDAVVDTQLRVIGVDRLRVIDASVMPVVVVGKQNLAKQHIKIVYTFWNFHDFH